MPNRAIANLRGAPAPFKRILLGTDFSLDSDRAARRVATLPLHSAAVVTVLHVLPPRSPRAAEALIRSAAMRAVNATAKKLRVILHDRGLDGVTVEPRLGRGHPVEGIGRVAQATDAELIVVGRGGHRLALPGSTAERVARSAGRPVLLVRRNPRASYRRAMAGYDFSPEAFRATSLLDRMVGTAVEEVTVANVYEDPFRGMPSAFLSPRLTRTLPNVRETLASRARLIRRTVPPLAARPAIWRVRLEHGDPRRALDRLARRTDVEVIALGTTGRTGLRHLLLGSVAESVLRQASADVVIVPRRRR